MDVERFTETQMSESWMLLNRYVTGISLSSIPTGKSQMSFRGLQRCGGGLSRVLGSTCQAFAIYMLYPACRQRRTWLQQVQMKSRNWLSALSTSSVKKIKKMVSKVWLDRGLLSITVDVCASSVRHYHEAHCPTAACDARFHVRLLGWIIERRGVQTRYSHSTRLHVQSDVADGLRWRSHQQNA